MENSKTIEALNELLQITNDRLHGFQAVDKKAIESFTGLNSDYEMMVDQATRMRSDLSALITEKGGEPENSTTIAGGLHRTWIAVKDAFSVNKDESTLENVTFGENAAIKAYEDALSSGELCSKSRELVQDQLEKLRSSYAKFSSLEDNAG
ncbi:PA2169 family four-helix-bundle protein [Halpernia frigidisoli]|uniref:DUF2383 domain-containing protein n=1 Tax=Halpernia frigidisoli TaxID=1125876 RepID=A0A1I3DLB2_9FLAO|nr:PA2169 family four-helix-bundle protein [Halpernia frigidisoli]SFH87517.1 conserved hypothetical protein [Halpernia frigidisoli]